jgi:CRP-like cAMP-binding protein/glyoxylase-like metal-dependent hydrolase (beta-lactamase superfamily II)
MGGCASGDSRGQVALRGRGEQGAWQRNPLVVIDGAAPPAANARGSGDEAAAAASRRDVSDGGAGAQGAGAGAGAAVPGAAGGDAAAASSKGKLASRRPEHLAVRTVSDGIDYLSDSERKADETPSPGVTASSAIVRQTSLTVLAEEEELKLKQYQARHGKRNSIVEYLESARRLQEAQLEFMTQKRAGTFSGPSNIRYLPRGGVYLPTCAGPVQFGIPPESIKDSLSQGLQLPSHYVLPKQRFNLQTGINVAEFEFPAYFNFFVLRKRINLIITREVEALIRTIFQETLLGPKEVAWPEVYSEAVPREAYPDLMKEMSRFRKNPFDPASELSIDTLIQFTYFEGGVARLEDGRVRIEDRGEFYAVFEDDKELASVPDYVILSPPPLLEQAAAQAAAAADAGSTPFFRPPIFGITMLGNSHGFDAAGATTGFVIWMNRRGIMVDPPPHSGAILKQHGIPPRLISGVILTHCHADHDAGTFQKILEEGRVVLYTTPVIKESFLRKYAAISGLEAAFLEKLFVFHPVVIGQRISVYSGELEFFYSLHTIPCVGFAAYCAGKSMVYSGDTLNDREGIERFFREGLMTAQRRDALLNFPWHHSVILHEAGVPPIHTPIKTLTALPEDVRQRLYVVHVAAKDIPKDSGLRMAQVGPENTVVLESQRSAHFEALEILELVANVDLFEGIPIDRAAELLQCARVVRYAAGATLITQNSMGETLYVIAMGVVSVSVDGNLVKHLTVGDHFGEMSIVTRQPRTATIVTCTEAELVEFRGHDFLHVVRGTNAIERLRHLGLMQREKSWQVIGANSVLRNLSSAQKTYLQSILRKCEAKRGDIVWEAGSKCRIAILIDDGLFFYSRAQDAQPFQRGAFVADMQSLLYSQPQKTTLVCGKDGAFYYIAKNHLLKFFEDNPGVLVYFKDRRFVE